MLLIFWVGVLWIFRFNSQFKSPTAAMLFAGNLTNLYLSAWLAVFSWSLNISVSWETTKAGMTLPICLQSADLIVGSLLSKKTSNLLHYTCLQIAFTRVELSTRLSPCLTTLYCHTTVFVLLSVSADVSSKYRLFTVSTEDVSITLLWQQWSHLIHSFTFVQM